MPYTAGYAIADIAALKALAAADLVNGYTRWVISKNNWYGWNSSSSIGADDDSVIAITEAPQVGRFIKAGYVEPTPQGTILTYASDGDTNGLLYWLGTNIGAAAWQNPQIIGTAIFTASGVVTGDLSMLSDRAGGQFVTNDGQNSFIQIEIAGNSKLICNYYSLRAWSGSATYSLRGWRLAGSNDNFSWDTIDVQTNNLSLNSPNKWLSIPVNSTNPYKYFKLILTQPNGGGSNEMTLGEIELYGTLS